MQTSTITAIDNFVRAAAEALRGVPDGLADVDAARVAALLPITCEEDCDEAQETLWLVKRHLERIERRDDISTLQGAKEGDDRLDALMDQIPRDRWGYYEEIHAGTPAEYVLINAVDVIHESYILQAAGSGNVREPVRPQGRPEYLQGADQFWHVIGLTRYVNHEPGWTAPRSVPTPVFPRVYHRG